MTLSPFAPAARQRTRLSELALAEFEHESALRSQPAERAGAYARLVMTLLVECYRPAVLTALSAAIANAIAAPAKPPVRRELLIRHFPNESARLFLASQRVKRWFPEKPLCKQLDDFHAALALAKAETILAASCDFEGQAAGGTAGHDGGLAPAWRHAARTTRALLTGLALELGNPPAGTAAGRNGLLALLEDAAAGRYGAVRPDGDVQMPDWAERRRDERVPVSIPARVQLDSSLLPATVSDISSGGIGLTGIEGLAAGDRVTVELRQGLSVLAAVVWVGDGKAGLELSRRLIVDDPQLRFLSQHSSPIGQS